MRSADEILRELRDLMSEGARRQDNGSFTDEFARGMIRRSEELREEYEKIPGNNRSLARSMNPPITLKPIPIPQADKRRFGQRQNEQEQIQKNESPLRKGGSLTVTAKLPRVSAQESTRE
jgi:hypothetical protein